MTQHDATVFRTLLSRRQAFRAAGIAGVAAVSGLLVAERASALSNLGVQKGLWGLYYYSGARDGDIGPVTQTAIRAFQGDRGLVVDGEAGPITQAELVAVVTSVQKYTGAPQDGDYGPTTVAEVKDFQQRWGGLEVDGRAGAQTMSAMGIPRVTDGDDGGDGGDGITVDSWNAPISRELVIDRAMSWVDDKRSYSMEATSPGPESDKVWRKDCSAFVSMAWGTFHADNPTGFTTGSLHPSSGYGVTTAISKADLKAGDILLITPAENGADWGHVGIFEKWADDAKTQWVILEQASETGGTARRTIGYPYSPSANGAKYKPYRYARITD
ncbi:peptidoglycan-binding domain-containing protein [Brachybacterium sp. AOP43-C2-M15]|uniref:peptidoglycan-binding domain-containing protein n=1 Tax=Brachybacterium sp. AOP43-C2-M15 TaxID=3457661 RepID=UPI004034B729